MDQIESSDVQQSDVVATFNYNTLPDEERRDLEAAAARVRALGKRVIGDIIEIGGELTRAKVKLRGKFLDWLDVEFRMTERTAERYMRAAAWSAGKSDKLSNVDISTLYLLSAKSTPVEAQTTLIEHISNGGTIGYSTAKTIIDEVKKTKKQAKREARKQEAEAGLGRRARRTRQQKEEEERRREKEASRVRAAAHEAALVELVELLLIRLGDDVSIFHEIASRVAGWTRI